MSVGSSSSSVELADGPNTAEVSKQRRLSVSEPELQRITFLMEQQLLQMTKMVVLLSAMSGITVDDDEIDLPTY